MLPDDKPIGRDVKTESADPFGNITMNPSMANLMADPLGTELVAGLTGPITSQSLPTDTEDVMGQPPQVNFDGGGGGVDATPDYTPADEDSAEVTNEIKEAEWYDSMMSRVKALNWAWIGTAVVVSGVILVSAPTIKKALGK
jgi:hypothetical protein